MAGVKSAGRLDRDCAGVKRLPCIPGVTCHAGSTVAVAVQVMDICRLATGPQDAAPEHVIVPQVCRKATHEMCRALKIPDFVDMDGIIRPNLLQGDRFFCDLPWESRRGFCAANNTRYRSSSMRTCARDDD